jgi:hypothetical protein
MNLEPMGEDRIAHCHCSFGPDVVSDLSEGDLLRLAPGERLWKLYCFCPAQSRATALQHRIYTKLKADRHLALVTFAIHTPIEGHSVRSGIMRVPDLGMDALQRIVEAIRRETNATPDEYGEMDLSNLATLDEQIEQLKAVCF